MTEPRGKASGQPRPRETRTRNPGPFQLSDEELLEFRIMVRVIQMFWRGFTSLVYLAIISTLTGFGTWLCTHIGWRWPWSQ